MPSDYSKIKLSAKDIEAGAYKKCLGGGAKDWEKRGAFQVELLRALGLRSEHTLLDVGCGPLRAGVHFIRILQPGNYWGVDFNASFIEAAHLLLAQSGMASAAPQVSVLDAFDFKSLGRTFDFLLCFSVLNHCTEPDRGASSNAWQCHARGSRLIVTHAGWFAPGRLTGNLRLSRSLDTEAALGAGLRFKDWGFDDGPGDRLPILEFAIA